MLKKCLIVIAVLLTVCLMASCDVSTDDPMSSSLSDDQSSAEESVLEQSQQSNASSALDESSVEDSSEESAPESIVESSETNSDESLESGDESSIDESSEDESVEVSYPDPTFGGGEVKPLLTPDEKQLPIRSLAQNEKNTLDLFGDIDLEDAETADAIARIQSLLDGYNKRISFFAYSLDGSRALTYNCEDEYFSACTIKAGYVLYCCLAIDQGLASKDEVMYYQEKYYHKGSGKIKNSEYGTPYTLAELIELSLSISDNVAYKMLNAYFGIDGYNEMIETLGVERLKLNSWSVWNNNTTARDLAIIWRELYFYFQTESPMSKLYYRSCTNTNFNYATRYLDEDYSHKSGDRFPPDPVCNDAAIVWKDIPYVVAVLNSSEDEKEDQEVMCGIVKIINDVLMQKNDLPEEEE